MSGNTEEEVISLQLQPKLVEAEKRLMISDADYEYLATFKPALLTRAAVGFVVPGAATYAACRHFKRRGVFPFAVSTSVAMLGGMFTAASYIPHIARDALLNLPSDSSLKMVAMDFAQKYNPDLSPQQIFTLTYRYQQQRGHRLPETNN